MFYLQIGPQLWAHGSLVFLPPYHTFQFRGKNKAQTRRIALLQLQTEGARRRERERASAGACVQGVTLLNNLPPILQLGCAFPKLQTMKTAGSGSPTVRVSFAVDDGNIKPASREWTSQSESPQLCRGSHVLPLIIHASYTRIRSTLNRRSNTRAASG